MKKKKARRHSAPSKTASTPSTPSIKEAKRPFCWSVLQVPALVLIVFVTAYISLSPFPESEKMMEGLDFFVFNSEFLLTKIAEYPALTHLLSAYLLQFFKDPTIGMIIEATMLAALTALCVFTPKAWGRQANLFFCILPALGLLMLCFHRMCPVIEASYFYLSLLVLGHTFKRGLIVQLVAILFMGLISFAFLSFPTTVLLMATLLVLQLIKSSKQPLRQRITLALLPLLVVGLVAFLVKLSSDNLGFIPFEKRWLYIPELSETTPFLILLVAPMVLMFVPRIGKPLLNSVLNLLIAVGAAIYCSQDITKNETYHTTEEVYHFAALAEEGEWQSLLDDVKQTGSITNNVYLQFALLAESELGTLADNLFSYPINTPETFCPRFDDTPLGTDFCRIFYRELGFVDEAYHQAFQYGIKTSQSTGFCFRSMRQMAQYSVAQADKPLAQKLLYILSQSSCHQDFVSRELEQLSKATKDTASLRANNFVKAYPFNSEMAHFLDSDSSNHKALDYLLCGLLLTKQLEIFNTVLSSYTTQYLDKPLPRAYAEAAAMIRHLNPNALNPQLRYDPILDQEFENFTALHNSKQDDSKYQGTFWYYYVYAQIPSPKDWTNPHSGATS